ncbi:MAG: penicillin-binding protein [Anaerolineales bacterium]
MNTRTARIIRARRRRRHQQTRNAGHILKWIIGSLGSVMALMVLGVLGIIGTGVGIYLYYANELPPPASIARAQEQSSQTTVMYDRTGETIIYEVMPPTEGDRQQVAIEDLPPYIAQATVALEDASFYENPGFDVRGIARAMWTNLTGGTVQGGSTITQQLVKNVLIPEEERGALSVDRKIRELILASEISRLYSKDQIMEWYLNTNFYGNLAYGIEAAARVYFDKSARELTLAEAALLVAIPQFPAQNPIDNPENARTRQAVVLREMVNEGYISQAEADAALAEQIIIRPFGSRFELIAPHFSLYARAEAERLLNEQGRDGSFLVSQGGLRIYTTLDVDLQDQMECAARTHVTRLDGAEPSFVHNARDGQACRAADALPPLPDDMLGAERHVTNAAGVVLRAETGEIMAMLGSVDYWNEGIDGNFNVATAERQPGSVFKPVVYLTAFLTPIDTSNIVTPATMLNDVETEFNNSGQPYVPQNFDRQFHGPVSVRDALANSYNVPVVQVLNWVGLSPVIRTAHRMGINSLNENLSEYGLSLALGAGEVTLLDMTYTYNVMNTLGYGVGVPVHTSRARQGFRQLDPTTILRIETSEGDILWEFSEQRGTFDRRLIMPSGMAYIMTDILADEEARLEQFASDNPLELARPAAAKTGTTDDNRDSWTIGYTPQYTTGVWVGNNDNRSMTDVTGITGAAPIWHAIMEYLHTRDAVPPIAWTRPGTVVEQTVCLWSGLLPTGDCPQVPREIFYVDTVNGVDYRPQRADDMWYRLAVDTCNNSRANETTPPQCVQENVFFDFPPEMQPWAAANAPDLLPPEDEGVVLTDSQFSPVALVSPRFPDQISGVIEIYGNTNVDDLSYFQVGFGPGNEPSSFVQIGPNGDVADFNQLLGEWDTRPLEDGVYTLRLQVIRADNSVESASTRVTVDNTPPEIRLTAPQEAATLSAQDDVIVVLESEVFDLGNIDRVEFYANDRDNPNTAPGDVAGVLLGSSDAFPYTYTWTIDDDGPRTFWAVAIDQAGNETASNRVTINLR